MLASFFCALVASGIPGGEGELFVSPKADVALVADGTRARPFRTLTAALEAVRAAVRAGGPSRLRLDLGRYDAAGGERFPLELPPGLELVGAGSPGTLVDGGGVARLFHLSGAGERVVAGLTLAGATVGLVAEAPVAAEERLTLRLRDVALTGLGTGLAFELGTRTPFAGTLAVHIDGLRASECRTGLAAHGVAPFELTLRASLFERCDVGVLLEADPAEDAARLGEKDAPQFLRVHHSVELRDTTFLANREAGFRRRGADGKNDGAPYLFEDCLFQSNDAGIEFVRPSADSEFTLRRSRFLANTRFGLLLTGYAGDPARFREVTDSLFRWNGIGVHATCVNLALERCRVQDNLGNGIFASNFLAEPTTTVVKNSLLTGNGASGFFGLADARLLTVELVHCTIAANAATGVYDKKRHAGKSQYDLRGCIVAHNGEDLHGLELAQVHDSWVESFGDAGRGDPLFRDAASGDWSLAASSPCREAGSEEGERAAGELDLDGSSRRHGARIDLGALESR